MANMTRRMITKRIGDVLLERGVITRKQFDEALAYQVQHGGLMGQLLIQLGFATEEGVALALTAQYGFPYLPLDNYEIDEGLTQIIPEQAARTHCLIPIDRIGNALTLAMADPSNVKAIEEIELMTKCVVQTFVSTPSDILKAIDKYYHRTAHPAPASEPPNTSEPPAKPKEKAA